MIAAHEVLVALLHHEWPKELITAWLTLFKPLSTIFNPLSRGVIENILCSELGLQLTHLSETFG